MAKFNVTNINTYGVLESMMASGFPKQTEIQYNSVDFFENYESVKNRSTNLATCKPGTGHNCFLKGIIVQMNITAPIYWWTQWDRYHFQDTVSSQSTMHKILDMDIEKQCNEYTDPRVIEITESKIHEYKLMEECGSCMENLQTKFQEIVSTAPRGLCLTRRVTTNYLQIQTMYLQRKAHKLIEWELFFAYLLPHLMYQEWITNSK